MINEYRELCHRNSCDSDTLHHVEAFYNPVSNYSSETWTCPCGEEN